MTMKKLGFAGVMIVALVGLSLATQAQVKKGKTRPLTTKQMMAGLVKPQCAGLGEALKAAPSDDKAWEELATKAALLNESGYSLMDDGRCPDGVWASACKNLQTASAAVLGKIEAKDYAGAQAEFKGVTASCGECHKAHKK